MPRRLIRALFAVSASAAAAATLGLSAAGPASASVSRMSARQATPGCLVLPDCVSVYQFGPMAGRQLVLEATGAISNAPVISSAEDPTDAEQDWTYLDLGTVGSYHAEWARDPLGLTGFDVAHYGRDELYQLEFSPAGVPTGLCAANVADQMVLRDCNGSRFQTMISANGVRGGRTLPLSYCYGLSVAQASVAARHLSVTGSRLPGERVTFSRPVTSGNQFWQPS